MNETAEIRDRLERIGVLARRGAGRSDLLREVRGLLEEGERRVRTEAEAPRGSGAADAVTVAEGREPGGTVSAPLPEPQGAAAVS